MKIIFSAILCLLASLISAQEALPLTEAPPRFEEPSPVWERAFSTMTKAECEDIITRTNTGLTMQFKRAAWQVSETPASKPFLGLYQYSNGDYLFVIAGPFYTAAAYYSPDRSPIGFMTYGEYLTKIIMIDPKYIGIDQSGYYKQAETESRE